MQGGDCGAGCESPPVMAGCDRFKVEITTNTSWSQRVINDNSLDQSDSAAGCTSPLDCDRCMQGGDCGAGYELPLPAMPDAIPFVGVLIQLNCADLEEGRPNTSAVLYICQCSHHKRPYGNIRSSQYDCGTDLRYIVGVCAPCKHAPAY